MIKKILLVLLIAFIGIQFIRIDKSTPEVNAADDFIAMTKPSEEVEQILRSACYDCHSYETEYPAYAEIAPVSWWLGEHIEDGRKHLNFSIWGTYEVKKADHKLEECIEEVEEGKMPLDSYTITHGDAKLTEEQIETLNDFFKKERRALIIDKVIDAVTHE